jgi:SAM-dependent methyltransferase
VEVPVNRDRATVEGFGDEWSRFDQRARPLDELRETFNRYFADFPWDVLPGGAVGFDLGCGSGRWARFAAERVGLVHCIDASPRAVSTAVRNLGDLTNCRFAVASAGELPLREGSMDFGYSLGVLHHIPDPEAGLRDAVAAVKPGAPFLVYLYYAFDNRPAWYRAIWRAADAMRRLISRFPHPARYGVTQVIAALVYLPLARLALLGERLGLDVDRVPLSAYRRRGFYAMRTDALDRFGTRLERRFTAREVEAMMRQAGLEAITFGQGPPYWCAVGFKVQSAPDA